MKKKRKIFSKRSLIKTSSKTRNIDADVESLVKSMTNDFLKKIEKQTFQKLQDSFFGASTKSNNRGPSEKQLINNIFSTFFKKIL